ncbi:MAG: HAMP domain-containing sensor histidine kinase [Lacisediminihabitans sp.]
MSGSSARGGAVSRWLGSLRGRITVVTVAVAILAVLVTGFVSVRIVQQSTLDAARTQLRTQTQIVSRLPASLTLQQLENRVHLALSDTKVGLVSADGVASGPAAAYLTRGNIRALLSGARVSLTHKAAGGSMLVEARRRASGGAVVLAVPLTSVTSSISQTGSRIYLALAIGIIVALLAGALLARWVAKPLVETAKTARRMAAGERGLRVAPHTPSEVADVADALAVLDAALATSESRQREFLLSISHELRTPLTAVRGYAEALQDGMIPASDISSVGQTLVGETERLDRFVADLLELARLEADDFSITRAPVNVAELLNQVRSAWQARSDILGVPVTVRTNGPPPTVVTDARRLRQIIDGLVENALRIAPTGTSVELITSAAPGNTVVQVRDSGPGLSAEDQAVAFERGNLRDRYRDIRPVGTGLGLSIASRLTARLGGTIGVSSSTAGTVFTVTLPSH